MTRILAAAAVALAFSAAPAPFSPVEAAGGGGSSTTPECRKGRVWSRSKKKCVKLKRSSGLSDDELLGNARTFAYAGRYRDALDALALAANERDPRILNYRGYATRKLGDVEGGLTFYRAALAIDPDYTLAREYMGEAFLTLGRVDLARQQLAEIERRCGTDCREYALLADEIAAFEAR